MTGMIDERTPLAAEIKAKGEAAEGGEMSDLDLRTFVAFELPERVAELETFYCYQCDQPASAGHTDECTTTARRQVEDNQADLARKADKESIHGRK